MEAVPAPTEPPVQYYDKSEFIETHTGNKVGRKSVLCGSQNIRLHGKVLNNSRKTNKIELNVKNQMHNS